MPTRITQVDDQETGRTILRVEGSLTVEDVELIRRICMDLGAKGGSITLDLAELHFLDSDSAHLLINLEREQGVMIEGQHLFVQRAIDHAERTADK